LPDCRREIWDKETQERFHMPVFGSEGGIFIFCTFLQTWLFSNFLLQEEIMKKVVGFLFLLCCLPGLLWAAPGDLDISFGTGGIVTTPVGPSHDYANAIVFQPDGKLVTAGFSYPASGYDSDFNLVRYNPDGSLDNTFGIGGTVLTPIGTGIDRADALVLQPDGKLVAAGFTDNPISRYDFALVRYNPDGSLDISFGDNGVVTTPIGSNNDQAHSIVLQSDGKLVVAGDGTINGSADFTIVRYNTDGSLDTNFGNNGIVTTPIGANYDLATAIVLQPDGKLVVSGSYNAGGDYDFALVRYNPDGTLDTNFGSGGIATPPTGIRNDQARALVLQPDGKLVAAGLSIITNDNNGFALARYNPDGTLDTGFGNGGTLVTSIGPSFDEVYSLNLQVDGKLVAGGTTRVNSVTYDDDFALVRYNSDGSLDTSFGVGGIITHPVGTSSDRISALTLQPDGKLVAAGFSGNTGADADVTVARYLTGLHGRVDINNGAAVTSDLNVTLDLTCLNDGNPCTEMQFSDDGTTWLGWQPYTTSVPFTLPSPEGETKTVYVQFKDALGNVSDIYSDSIDWALPTFGVPKFITLNADRDGNLYVVWDDSRTPDVNYELEIKQGTGAFTPVTIAPERWYLFNNLPSDTYTLRVRVLKAGMIESPWRESAPVDIAWTCAGPAKFYYPTKTIINRKIDLSWAPSRTPGVIYTLEMSVDGGPFSEVQSGSSMSYQATGMADGSYVFRLKAGGVTDYADSGWYTSEPINLTLSCFGVPRIWVRQFNPYGEIQVNWKASRTPSAEYVLEISKDSGAFSEIYRGVSNGHRISGLGNGDYQFRVMATRTGRADSAWALSNSANVTLTARPPWRVYSPMRAWDGNVTLSWVASKTPGVNNYLVEASVDGGAFASVGSATGTSLTLNNIPAGITTFRVTAQAPGYLDSVPRTSATTDVAYQCYIPLKVTAPASSANGQVYLYWLKSRTAGASYEIEANYQGSGWTQVAAPTETGVLLTGLAAGDYIFRVRAVKTGTPVFTPSSWRPSGTVTITAP
jgi:uncharacterized delta-60 repeat protein